MFDHSKLWLDVGYRITDGSLDDGHKVRLARSQDTSPQFLEHSPPEDLIQFLKFDSKEEQAAWISNEIENNIAREELEPDDIIVINPDPISTRNEVGLSRRMLFEKGIESHLAGVDVSPDVFFDKTNKSVAFTGIFRAKGNEAGMVYIMNAHQCVQSFGSLARVRNQLFTAITRSKSWVRVLGVGVRMDDLITEYEKIKDANYQLNFTYPTEEMRRKLNIINRDMTVAEKQSTMTSIKSLNKTLDDIDAGRVMVEDLPEDTLERLRTLLASGAKNG
jgi:superfamily I DNA and RNA helicase